MGVIERRLCEWLLLDESAEPSEISDEHMLPTSDHGGNPGFHRIDEGLEVSWVQGESNVSRRDVRDGLICPAIREDLEQHAPGEPLAPDHDIPYEPDVADSRHDQTESSGAGRRRNAMNPGRCDSVSCSSGSISRNAADGWCSTSLSIQNPAARKSSVIRLRGILQ